MYKMVVDVALSGGVDSSVTAYILKKDGYDVRAVFIDIQPPQFVHCTASEDRVAAMRTAAALNIPFRIINATDEYTKKVIEPFIEEYRKGLTPNPDILCNKFIKFDLLYKSSKADKIATGHYACLGDADGTYRLYSGIDKTKDQTYFLWAIDKKVFPKTLFPLGTKHKKEVRAIADRARLPSAQRPDSVGLCFVGDISIRHFLQQYIPIKYGSVQLVRDDTTIVGTHSGACFYTIGQRHGFTLHNEEQGPYFVIGKDIARNILWVSRNKEDAAFSKQAYVLHNTNWFHQPNKNEKLLARWRHLQPLSQVQYEDKTVTFTKAVSIAHGQSVVLYNNQGECCGGGIA